MADVPLPVSAVIDSLPTRLARVLSIVYGLILIFLSVIPSIDAPGVGLPDWILHAVAYGGFAGLLLVSGVGPFKAIFGAGGLGLATEFLQLLIPYRRFEFSDLVADVFGALITVLVGLIFLKSLNFSRQADQ